MEDSNKRLSEVDLVTVDKLTVCYEENGIMPVYVVTHVNEEYVYNFFNSDCLKLQSSCNQIKIIQ